MYLVNTWWVKNLTTIPPIYNWWVVWKDNCLVFTCWTNPAQSWTKSVSTLSGYIDDVNMMTIQYILKYQQRADCTFLYCCICTFCICTLLLYFSGGKHFDYVMQLIHIFFRGSDNLLSKEANYLSDILEWSEYVGWPCHAPHHQPQQRQRYCILN